MFRSGLGCFDLGMQFRHILDALLKLARQLSEFALYFIQARSIGFDGTMKFNGVLLSFGFRNFRLSDFIVGKIDVKPNDVNLRFLCQEFSATDIQDLLLQILDVFLDRSRLFLKKF